MTNFQEVVEINRSYGEHIMAVGVPLVAYPHWDLFAFRKPLFHIIWRSKPVRIHDRRNESTKDRIRSYRKT